MRRQVLLFAGMSLFLCSGLNAQSQKSADDPIWEMGFEAGTEMFDTASEASLAGYIHELEYYGYLNDGQEIASGFVGSKGSWFTPDYDAYDPDTTTTLKIDTVFAIRHGISPYKKGDREDRYQFNSISFEDNLELQDLGVDPSYDNKYYLRYLAGNGTSDVNDYEANLFARGIDITEHTSYRLTFYMRVDNDTAHLDARLLRGWYDSEKPFTMDASGSEPFIGDIKAKDWIDPETQLMPENMLGKWKRYTFMYYYSSDSLTNRFCQSQFYWSNNRGQWGQPGTPQRWEQTFQKLKYKLTPEQAKMFTKKIEVTVHYIDDDGIEQDSTKIIDSVYAHKIVQPSQFFLRLAFEGPNTTYDVDQISVYKSLIGCAEWNAGSEQIRVNLGYETNIAELCKKSPIGRIVLQNEAEEILPGVFDITVKKDDQIVEGIEIVHIEYQSDGMIYLWLNDAIDATAGYKMWLTFHNPEAEEYQLKYTGKQYPNFEDEAWVKAGKIVKDFENEQILKSFFPDVPAIWDVPPTITKAEPVEKSFNLGETHKQFKLYLTRPAFIDDAEPDYSMTAYLGAKKDGEEAITLSVGSMDMSDTSVVVTLPRKPANGIYDLVVEHLCALNEDGSHSDYISQEPVKIEYTWGKDYINDVSTNEGVYYKKLVDAYAKDTAYINTLSSIKDKPKVLTEFINFVASYAPETFIDKHFAPADYVEAETALKNALENIKKSMGVFDKFTEILATAKAEIEDELTIAVYGETKRYADLKDGYQKYSTLDIKKASIEEITEAYNIMFGLCNGVYAIPALKAQALDLYSLVKIELGADFTAQTKDIIEEAMPKLEDDDRYIVSLLKLEAVRAIYSTLQAGTPIVDADASGFIANPEFYMTGVLDKEIVSYTASWHDNVTAYRVKNDTAMATVFPGWEIKTSIDSDPYGVWAGDCEDEWNPSMGLYNVAAGQVLAGMLGCDWKSEFTIKQNITDLPAGQYTIVMGNKNDPVHAETTPNDRIIANNDTLDAQSVDSTTITTTLEEAGDLYVEFTHNKVDRSVLMKEVMLYLNAEKDPLFDYGAAITEIDKAIDAVKTNITTSNYNNAVELYNMKGVRVDALRPGEIGIRIMNGVAEKVLF